MNKLEVIGIDHGWSMMKTVSQVSSLKSSFISCMDSMEQIFFKIITNMMTSIS